MMHVIGIDPAKRITGLAVLTMDGELVDSTLHRESDLLEDTVHWIDQYLISEAMIEDQYLGLNPRSALLVAKAHGYWMGVCEMNDIITHAVLAKTWQEHLLECKPRTKRQERKRLAKEYVRQRFGVSLCEDECDAVCIACYYLETKCEH